MASLPRSCCAGGSLHTGTPTGNVEKRHGFDCYVAEPPSGSSAKGVIVIFPDIFGWTLPNSRILADEYAKKAGALVLLPDFMNGHIIPADLITSLEALNATGLAANLQKVYHIGCLMYHMLPFLFWYNPPKVVRPRIHNFLKALRANEARDLPVGTAGFCWGGKWVVELCDDTIKTGDGKSLVDCGFTAHPSQLSIPGDIEKVKLPLSIAASEFDPVVTKDNVDTMKAVLDGKAAKGKDQGIDHEVVWYAGAHHGFAVRANEKDMEEAERGKKAEKQAVDWYTRWFTAYGK